MKTSVILLAGTLVLGALPGLATAHGAPGAPAHRHWNGYTFYAAGSQYVPTPFEKDWGEFVPTCATVKAGAGKSHRPKVFLEEE